MYENCRIGHRPAVEPNRDAWCCIHRTNEKSSDRIRARVRHHGEALQVQ